MDLFPTDETYAMIEARHGDPAHFLGLHSDQHETIVRAYIPGIPGLRIHTRDGTIIDAEQFGDAGLFAARLKTRPTWYRFENVADPGNLFDDAYRFPSTLSEYDLYLLAEGSDQQLYDKLGAHMRKLEGVEGVSFAVFAPCAERVAVVGDFNGWDTRRHPMRRQGQGYWDLFVPGAHAGQHYKFDIRGYQGAHVAQKADPIAFYAEVRPKTASIIYNPLKIDRPRSSTTDINARSKPISIYEIHLGSWRRGEDNRWLTYLELAEQLPRYVKDLGFTHIEFLPVNEHPFDGSWGYQPTGLFAPTSRFGSPEEFAKLVDACHADGLGVILDWVPGHFPDDPHGLGLFDGTAVYEHANPMQGRHLDWGTLIYNYGRREVMNMLVSNALFWFDRFNVDGLRVDAVASMLYLDYSRPEGQWIPNQHGGRENLEAVAFLQRFNRELYARFPKATTIAEESTSWPQVSRPVDEGGLGFGYKWNMGWMHDTLDYISQDPIHRQHHHDKILFGLHYAYTENFVLPLSHDEVVHGKHSILGRMPGDEWQRFANLRAYYAFMFAHPGKKLLFMGCEFAQEREWNHDQSLDWHLLDRASHKGIQSLIRDLNRLYRDVPSLHERDCEQEGFEWLVTDDRNRNVFAWVRNGFDASERCVVIVNFSPNVYQEYALPVPMNLRWREIMNTDAAIYGGGNVGNAGSVIGENGKLHLTLPPLAALYLTPEK